MQTESIAHRVQKVAHTQFRSSVARPNPAHQLASLARIEDISHFAVLGTTISQVAIAIATTAPQRSRKITITNASKRKVILALSTDPDIRIQEEFQGKLRNKVAIEIKGGTDISNAHNRSGEAEKSHQKAKKQGFRDFWTLISKSGLSMEKLKQESPTTNSWFDVAQVLARQGDDWKDFRSRFAGEAGIPLD